MGPTRSAAAIVKAIVERVECRCDVVEFIVKQIRVGVRGHGNRCVAHSLPKEPQVGTGSTRQRSIGMPQIVHAQIGSADLSRGSAPVDRALPVLQAQPGSLRRCDCRRAWDPCIEPRLQRRHQALRNRNGASTRLRFRITFNELAADLSHRAANTDSTSA